MGRHDDFQPETPAQWLEHSEAWRYAHLDRAPSEYFKQMAILEHERLLLAPVSETTRQRPLFRRSASRRR